MTPQELAILAFVAHQKAELEKVALELLWNDDEKQEQNRRNAKVDEPDAKEHQGRR